MSRVDMNLIQFTTRMIWMIIVDKEISIFIFIYYIYISNGFGFDIFRNVMITIIS